MPVADGMLPVPYGMLFETELVLLELPPVERGFVWRVNELTGLLV